MNNPNQIHPGAFGHKEAPDPKDPKLAENHIFGEVANGMLISVLPTMAERFSEELVRRALIHNGKDQNQFHKLKETVRNLLREAVLYAMSKAPSFIELVNKRSAAIQKANERKAEIERNKRRSERDRTVRETERIKLETSELMAFRKAALDLLSVEDFMMIRDLAATEMGKLK